MITPRPLQYTSTKANLKKKTYTMPVEDVLDTTYIISDCFPSNMIWFYRLVVKGNTEIDTYTQELPCA